MQMRRARVPKLTSLLCNGRNRYIFPLVNLKGGNNGQTVIFDTRFILPPENKSPLCESKMSSARSEK